MTCAISRRLSALAAAHGGPVLARPSGQTTVGYHGGMAPGEEVVSPCVRPSWDDRGDTAVTRYRVLRRDAAARGEDRFAVIDGDTGSARTQYVDRSFENDMRHVYRAVTVNEQGESRWSGSAEADTYLVAIVPFPGSVDAPPEH